MASSLLHLAGAQATGADPDAARSGTFLDANPLEIRLPASFGYIMGVADV